MQNKVSIIILTGNTQTRKVLELYLSEFEHFEVLDKFADYTEIYDTLAMFDKSVLIVDVSDNFDSKLDFISNVSQNIHNCKIAVLSDNPSVDLIVRVMRAGAREFLPLPLIKTEFIEALSRINESQVKAKGCDSVFARGGVDLRNDEYIVYNSNQCTIRYLIELNA